MTLYIGFKIAKEKILGTNQNIVKIKGSDFDDYFFAPISSSTQAVSRYVSMPSPGTGINTGGAALSITPYHITKGHDWASRHIESCIYNKESGAIDIYIINAVTSGADAGLLPLFVKHLEGAYIAGLTREIDGDGSISETISIIFQKCSHTYNEVKEGGGEIEKIEIFAFDLNVGISDSSAGAPETSTYQVPAS